MTIGHTGVLFGQITKDGKFAAMEAPLYCSLTRGALYVPLCRSSVGQSGAGIAPLEFADLSFNVPTTTIRR
jgi:hypothetical protein